MENITLLLTLAACFGLFMAWGIGANDVANAMATSVGSKAISLKTAVFIAAIFEFTGAYLAGGKVTETIRSGIVDRTLFINTPELLVYGMLASLLAAGIWLLVATRFGLPVSTTHSIVGAIVGFSIASLGVDAVNWTKIQSIIISWVASPALAGCLSYLLFKSVQTLVLNTNDPFKKAKLYVPVYIFFTGFTISLITLFKGLKHIGLELSTQECYLIACAVGIMTALIGSAAINRIKLDPSLNQKYHFRNVEQIFGILMIFTACSMAFAHGSNDVANAVGPVAAVVGVLQSGSVTQTMALPPWVLLLGGFGIVIGLVTYGHKVIATVGTQITDLTPSRGFCCEMGAAFTVVLASSTGIPISTTHTLVGAVLGVGFARGMSALNLRIIGSIFMSWIVTLPAGAILAIIFYNFFRVVL